MRAGQVVAEVLEVLSAEQASDLVAGVVTQRAALDRLSDHVLAHPDAFVSGSSGCPRVMVDLLVALVDAGIDGVRLARCARCDRPERNLQIVATDGRLCDTCHKRENPEECAGCARTLPMARRLPTGEALCNQCASIDRRWWQPCSICGTRSQVVSRVAGEPIGRCCYVRPALRCTMCGTVKGKKEWKSRRLLCEACVERPRVPCGQCGCDAAVPPPGDAPVCAACATTRREPCESCGLPTPVRDRRSGRPHCPACYRRPTRACGRCGRVREVVRLAVGDDPDLCAVCWTGPTVVCADCGQLRPCRGERRGRMLCSKCAPVAPHRCAHCGQNRRVQARWHEGPVCTPCYHRALAAKGPCPTCGEIRRLMTYPNQATKVCASCAGAPPLSVCDRCGTEDWLYRRGLCPACSLRSALDELLGDADARATNGLQPVFDRLVALDQSRWVLEWLSRGAAAAVLARFATGDLPLDHRAFDQIPAGRNAWFVERLLVAAGAMPARDPVLARMERWTADYLAEIADVERRQLLSRYSTWQLLRPLRIMSAAAPLSDNVHNGRKQELKAAQAFLDWLASDGRSLADCTQAVTDRWAIEGPPHWRRAQPFLKWAHQQRLVGTVEFPKLPARVSASLMDTEQRWAVARRLLHEPDIDPAVRVAGLLVILYAQPVSKIARLRSDQVSANDDHTELLLGSSPIRLPAPLDEHIAILMQRHPPRTVSQMTGDERWIFAGAMAGRPMHATTLANRLIKAGVPVSAHRPAALAHLAATMPAAIVADLLGVSIGTATRWAALTGRPWADYLAHH